MKNKKLLLLPVIALMVVLMASMVSAAVMTCAFDQTATIPGTRSTYIDGIAFNISGRLDSGSYDIGSNISAAILTNSITATSYVYNDTTLGTNASYFNASIDTTEFTDEEDSITFTWTVKNETQDILATCTRTYYADNGGVPIVNTGMSPADEVIFDSDTERRNVAFSITCTNTSSAILYLNENAHTMSESSDTCTYSKAYLPDQVWNWYVIASDGINTTTSETRQIHVTTPGGGGSNGAATSSSTATGKSNFGNLILIAIFAYIIYNVKTGEKKGRKK